MRGLLYCRWTITFSLLMVLMTQTVKVSAKPSEQQIEEFKALT